MLVKLTIAFHKSNPSSVVNFSSIPDAVVNFSPKVVSYETSTVSVSINQSSTTSRPKIMKKYMKEDLELITDATQGHFSHINR